MIAAHDVNEARAVRGEGQLRDFLALVQGVGRNLTRFKIRTGGDPNVARAGEIADPGDAVGALRGGERVRAWIPSTCSMVKPLPRGRGA